MFGVPGWIELLLLLSMGGGAGVPLGVPPGPEDPLMARIPAEECIFYTTWSGVAEPAADGGNRTEALLAEKEMQHAVAELEKVIVRGLRRAAEEESDPTQAILLGELFPQLGKLAVTRPACFYVTKFELKRFGAPDMQAGMVIRVDEQGPEVRRIIEKLESSIIGKGFRELEIEGSKYHQLELGGDVPTVTWGIRGKYLIVCLGKNAVPAMFDSVRAGQPKWLKDLRTQFPVERVSTVTYVDLKKTFTLVKIAGFAPLAAMIEAGGLNKLSTYASVTGLDETGFVHRTALGIDGEAKGMLSLLDGKPLAEDDLARIPADAPAAIALRVNAEQTYGSIVEMIGQMNGVAATDMEAQIERGAGMYGIKVREQVVASLGDHAYIYAAPHDGDLIMGWTGVVQIRDYMTLFQVHQKLVAMFQEKLQADVDAGRRRVPKINSTMAGHHTIHFLSVPDDDMPFAPAWCLTREGLVFGLFPQSVKAHILRDARTESLIDREDLAKHLKAGDDGPIAMAYFDSKRIVELLYPMAQMGIQALANELRRDGFDLDVSFLPSVASVTKHLRPRINMVRRTAAGIEIHGHQTLPGGSLGSSAPLIASATVPAIITARKRARRMQAQGHMRQITIALHNFHEVKDAFPAAYSIDKDRKPLLSWRVHLLPYIEHQPLYDRFRLDQPWDSEHNKKLIAEMPRIYRSPASRAEPGHTNILAVRGKNAVIVVPNDEQKGKDVPAGIRVTGVTDGTANTIMIVEGNDTVAVPWTKPDDFPADRKEPLQGLSGLYGPGFHAGLADASVRFIYDGLSTENLQHLLDRRDGNRIDPDDFQHGSHRGVRVTDDVSDLEVDVDDGPAIETREEKVEEKPAAEPRPEPPKEPEGASQR